MSDAQLNPGLKQLAEQYLARSLTPDEEQQLISLQQHIQSQPTAGPTAAAQQARQQAQQTISQGQSRASSNMRTILESIQNSTSQALQVQQTEEQAILKLLEGTQSLSELRPSHLQTSRAGLQPGSQLALTQIAEHLSNLAKQEVQNCFNQYFGPLTQQLQQLVGQLQAEQASKSEQNEAASSASGTPASATGMPALPVSPQAAAGVHNDGAPASM